MRWDLAESNSEAEQRLGEREFLLDRRGKQATKDGEGGGLERQLELPWSKAEGAEGLGATRISVCKNDCAEIRW